MKEQASTHRPAGLVLVFLGVVFLAEQLWPGLFEGFSWPLIVVAIGILFLLSALLAHQGALAIPGSIIGGIGTLLFWQNSTGNWESWAYAWTLIPGFVGVGIIFAHLLGERQKGGLLGGLTLLAISGAGFLLFGGFFNGGWLLLRFWPVLLIVLGLSMLVRSFLRPA